MAWTALLALLGVALGADALRTSFSARELRDMSIKDAQLEATYRRAAAAQQQPRAADNYSANPSLLYQEYNLSVPVDHFHNDSLYEPHTNDTFDLRYWFDASHYLEGGPVIVLNSGETSGVNRLSFLQKGIVSILARATGGLGVILEHRYYGTSYPVPDLSIENLRFLTTDQALADMAYFAQNVQFQGLEHLNLTAPNVPYIAYGGSYAGALVAFLRKLYPDVYWGAIASSAVTEAIYDYWEYYTAALLFAPGDCANTTQALTNVIDNILIGKNGTEYVQRLKDVYGLGGVNQSADFAAALIGGITALQNTNWDPAINDTTFGEYCDTIGSTDIVYEATASKKDEVIALLQAAGYGDDVDTPLTNRMLNYIGFINETIVSTCQGNQNDCFKAHKPELYEKDDLNQTWRAWPYQYCFEWGFLQTGSGVPEGQLPLISRLLDVDFNSIVCEEAFNITTPPQIERINQFGGFDLSYPRLAFVDGKHDPWRAATPHAIGLPDRVSTTSEPFILIDYAVHHWDENGLFANETTTDLPPAPIRDAQRQEVEFVRAWVDEWKSASSSSSSSSSMAG